MLLNIVYILIFGLGVKGDVACKRNPALPYCNLNHVRRKQANKPEDPFKEKFEPKSIEEPKGNKGDEDISIEIGDTNQIQSSRIRSTTPVSLPPQNILYTIFPTLQNEKNWQKYCPINQYTFQITCLPGKKLRYDLMKQKNGNLGLGTSFGFGLGALPVFNKLGGNRSNKPVKGYEPGYGAVNPNAPLAIGKVDRDALNLPGGFGDVEIEKGGGFGIGNYFGLDWNGSPSVLVSLLKDLDGQMSLVGDRWSDGIKVCICRKGPFAQERPLNTAVLEDYIY
uniref:Uncharacterized protein n=1 Tax=Heterorhabditis bacteriophora TaxID=37862 RepID=A0A1I7XQU2_HETBA